MKHKRVSTRIHTRKIDRLVARNKMRASGRRNVTSKEHNRYKTKKNKTFGREVKRDPQSYFAKNWRVWAA